MSQNLTPVLPRAVTKLGFWSAILSAILALSWLVTMIIQSVISPPQPWLGIQSFVQSFKPIQMFNLIPSLPLASTFLVLMVCIYFYASEQNKVWAMVGLAFTIVYAVMASTNYLIQLLVVRYSLSLGEIEGLGLFAHANPHSVFWALANSYGYMSLGMLFAAWVFGATRIERWVRWLFLAVGITAPLQFIGVLLQLGLAIGAPAGAIWSIGTPAACLLIAVLFRRAERGNQ